MIYIYIGNKKDISDRNFLCNVINKSDFNSLKNEYEIYDCSKESDSEAEAEPNINIFSFSSSYNLETNLNIEIEIGYRLYNQFITRVIDDFDIRLLNADAYVGDTLIKSKNDIWYYIFDKKDDKIKTVKLNTIPDIDIDSENNYKWNNYNEILPELKITD